MEYVPYQLVFSPDFWTINQWSHVFLIPLETPWALHHCGIQPGCRWRGSFPPVRWRINHCVTEGMFEVWLHFGTKPLWSLISLDLQLSHDFLCCYAWQVHWGKRQRKDSSTDPEQSFWDINSKWEVGSAEFFAWNVCTAKILHHTIGQTIMHACILHNMFRAYKLAFWTLRNLTGFFVWINISQSMVGDKNKSNTFGKDIWKPNFFDKGQRHLCWNLNIHLIFHLLPNSFLFATTEVESGWWLNYQIATTYPPKKSTTMFWTTK